MTDREKVEALFNELGVDFRDAKSYDVGHGLNGIVINADEGEKVLGYTGFVCVWSFDKDGNFHTVGIWE